MIQRLDLNGQWAVKVIDGIPADSEKNGRLQEWIPATVPGTIHTDLLNEGIIPDPFYRMNENEVQWIENCRWLYRREFNITDEFLKERYINLNAEGLDTYATISINGKTAGKTENMFVEHRFNIKKYLQPGLNNIEILFDSPAIRPKQLEKKYGALRVALEPHRVFVRKAQYSYSWDWGPKLTTSGIWRSISIDATSSASLRDPFVKIIEVNKKSAVIHLSVKIENYHEPISVRIKISGEGHSQEIVKKASSSILHCNVIIQHPNIWWPNGYGSQPLYMATFAIEQSERDDSEISTSFGIRTIRLLQEKDKEGKSFVIVVNDVKIFCKGADWIPSDSFIPRIPDTTYERLITMARDAHMNMLRVWGGGIYEQEIFYTICDSLGILVWQDFMFACGEYPQSSWFLSLVKDEAQKAVVRLRNHPSIAVWCGNNECEWLFCTENPEKTPDDMNGSVIFRELLPNVLKQFDGTRPYWRSSPFGTGFPNDETNGTHHQWNVWSFWKDYKDYEKVNARFVSEFGFQAPANIRTWEEVTFPEDRDPQNPVIEHHNKQVEGQERLYRFQYAHYKLATDFTEFVYQGQLVQANALKTAVEHWRRRKFKTSGAMYWQLNDCWPVSSWAVIDSSLRPKASYFYSKRFFANVLLSFKKTGEVLEVWGTNDTLEKITSTLQICVTSITGEKLSDLSINVVLKPNSSSVLHKLKQVPESLEKIYSVYVLGQLMTNGEVISGNRFFFSEPKHLNFPNPSITHTVSKLTENTYQITLHTDSFAKDIRVEIDEYDAVFSDNYFDMDAGSFHTILCTISALKDVVERNVRIKSLHY